MATAALSSLLYAVGRDGSYVCLEAGGGSVDDGEGREIGSVQRHVLAGKIWRENSPVQSAEEVLVHVQDVETSEVNRKRVGQQW